MLLKQVERKVEFGILHVPLERSQSNIQQSNSIEPEFCQVIIHLVLFDWLMHDENHWSGEGFLTFIVGKLISNS